MLTLLLINKTISKVNNDFVARDPGPVASFLEEPQCHLAARIVLNAATLLRLEDQARP